MLKYLYNICLTTAILFSISGCSKWLDVMPKDKLVDSKLFVDADGFRNAINGVYQQVANTSLYGRNLTWGIPSSLGQDYTLGSLPSPDYYFANFNFTHSAAISAINQVWGNAYNVIANCNKIIREVELKDSTDFPLLTAERNVILGEAIAMRALLHFEMVRLFATPPAIDKSGKFIPYQKTYPGYYMDPMSNEAVMDSIINDLELAQSLVARNDTVINRTMMSYGLQSLFTGGNTPNGGLFFNYRMHRLNYVAIQGLLARVYMYNGDYTNALAKAEYLYKNFSPSPSTRLKWWTWTSSGNVSGTDKYHKMPEDVLFGPYNANMVADIKSIKYAATLYRLAPEAATDWFPVSPRDNRAYLYNVNTSTTVKWAENLSTGQFSAPQNFLIPVIRFSEIYYIYSECLFRSGDKVNAMKILNEVRTGRGRPTLFTDDSEEGFFNELFMEYRREFIEDGQTVFNFKRIARPMPIGSRVLEMDKRFVLPIPEGEQIF